MLLTLLFACSDSIDVVEVAEPARVEDQSVVCTALRADASPPQVVRIGMDDGAMYPVVAAAGPVPDSAINGLADFGDHVVVCRPELTRISLVDGTVTPSDVKCSSAADVGGELLLLDGDELVSYPTFDDAAAGVNGVVLPARPYASRVGRDADAGELLTAWHSDGKLERWSGGSSSKVDLRLFDTWIWGVSQADARLFVLDDGRDAGGPSWWEAIHEFDAKGVPVRTFELGEDVKLQGLSCSVPVPPTVPGTTP